MQRENRSGNILGDENTVTAAFAKRTLTRAKGAAPAAGVISSTAVLQHF
jgi:hypothetical protein